MGRLRSLPPSEAARHHRRNRNRNRRVAAELGSEGARGPGSLRVGLLDSLHGMTEAQLLGAVRLSSD